MMLVLIRNTNETDLEEVFKLINPPFDNRAESDLVFGYTLTLIDVIRGRCPVSLYK